MLLTPSPSHKLSHLLGPPTPLSVTYFMDGPFVSLNLASLNRTIFKAYINLDMNRTL